MHLKFLYNNLLIIVFVVISSNCHVVAQTNETDTVGIIEKIVEKIDTVVRTVVPDTILRKWADQPIDSVLFRDNTRFKKGILNLLIKDGQITKKTPSTNTSLAAMDGATIRKIHFKHVDIFTPSVTDTNYTSDSWFERMVNISHNDTRRIILERYLLLKTGDKLDVFLAAENERILRDLSFIMDARFIPVPVKGSPDSVDLLLITQDIFPLGLRADIENSNLALLGFSHQNIFGYGHQLSATTYWDVENKPLVGYSLSYGSSNIAGTFTTGRLEYIHRWNQESYLVDFSRNFRTMSFRNAGGFSFESTNLLRNVDLLDTIFSDIDLKYSVTDMWAGRILVPLRYSGKDSRSGFFVAGRLNKYNSLAEARIDDAYLYPFQDRTLLLFSAGISRQGFKKDNLIYTFGRTEDVPYGYLFNVTAGTEWTDDMNRSYMSLGAAYGKYFNNSAYLYGQIRFGSFFYGGKTEQGALNLQLRFFSMLHEYKRFQYRNFISLSYMHGINRKPGEFISLSHLGGIYGLFSKSMRGTDKLALNAETILFSPYYLFGFRFAFFGGMDLGLIKLEEQRIIESRLFSGFNIGVRIRNDQLVFNTFVIRLSIYPWKAKDGTARYFIIDNVPRLRFNDFFPTRPEVVPFQ